MTRPARTTLLINPTAGRGRAGRILPRVAATLSRSRPHTELAVAPTADYAAAADAARSIVADAAEGDALVVMGGDGMIGLGIDAAAGSGVPLGMIPAGTGNDICRGLGVPRNPLRAAELMDAAPRRFDTIGVVDRSGKLRRHVGSVVASGFDARVNARANRLPIALGSINYAVALLAETVAFHPLSYRIVVDGVTRRLPALMIAVGNTPYYGGGIQIAPGADPTDGLLDVTVIHPVDRATLLRLMPALYRGNFVHHPAVERFRAARIELDGAGVEPRGDGEELFGVPVELRAEPGALLAFAPGPADR